MNIYKQRYFEQKQAARQRGISFELTFDQWFAIWQDSGKWELRGRGKGSYVMSRIGDVGPYAIDNVYIIVQEQNASEGSSRAKSVEHRNAISKALNGKKKNLDAVIKNAQAQLMRPKYMCQHCDKTISGAGNLKQHIASKHKETQ